MDTFSEALLSSESGRIPEEYDWFAPLVGDWDCDYYDGKQCLAGTEKELIDIIDKK